tara:strand:+ start:1490 stop:3184 length:1695 start_codon:yes stop_codon:yes gene_type:complete
MDMATTFTLKANVTGQNQIKGLEKGLGQLSRKSDATAGAMKRLKGAAGGAIGALKSFLPVLGVVGLAKLGNDVLQLGDKLQKLSVTTGVSVETLDKLRQASQKAGTDFTALQKAMPVLAKNMQDASDGVGTAKEAFDRIGFSAVDSSGKLKTMDQAIFEIADLMNKTTDPALNLANASEIFGSTLGRKLIPLLKEGSESIKAYNTGFTQESAEKMATFNDAVTELGEQFRIVAIELTTLILPAIHGLVNILSFAAGVFNAIPMPIKAIAGALIAIVAPFALVTPLTAAFAVALKGIAALKIGAVFATIATKIGLVVAAVVKVIGVIATLATAPAAPFIAIGAGIVGLGAVIFKFRDEIFSVIGNIVDSFVSAGQKIVDVFKRIFPDLGTLLKNVFQGVINSIKNFITQYFSFVTKIIQTAFNALKRLFSFRRSASNRSSSSSSSPQGFARGGIVSSPQLALVGEGGEREYIIPESKLVRSAVNVLQGKRGNAVIPAFAQGGVVGGSGYLGSSSPTIHIQTGAVLQQNNTQYVTVKDLENALTTFSNAIFNNSRSVGGRRFQGVG